jgi:hypothetical protein
MGVLNRDSAEPMDLGVFMAPIFTQTSFYLVRTQNWCVIPCDNALSSISWPSFPAAGRRKAQGTFSKPLRMEATLSRPSASDRSCHFRELSRLDTAPATKVLHRASSPFSKGAAPGIFTGILFQHVTNVGKHIAETYETSRSSVWDSVAPLMTSSGNRCLALCTTWLVIWADQGSHTLWLIAKAAVPWYRPRQLPSHGEPSCHVTQLVGLQPHLSIDLSTKILRRLNLASGVTKISVPHRFQQGQGTLASEPAPKDGFTSASSLVKSFFLKFNPGLSQIAP